MILVIHDSNNPWSSNLREAMLCGLLHEGFQLDWEWRVAYLSCTFPVKLSMHAYAYAMCSVLFIRDLWNTTVHSRLHPCATVSPEWRMSTKTQQLSMRLSDVQRHTCIVRGSTQFRDWRASFQCFPSERDRRLRWLWVFEQDECQLRPQLHMCSQHFLYGDANKEALVNVGKKVYIPDKEATSMSKTGGSTKS